MKNAKVIRGAKHTKVGVGAKVKVKTGKKEIDYEIEQKTLGSIKQYAIENKYYLEYSFIEDDFIADTICNSFRDFAYTCKHPIIYTNIYISNILQKAKLNNFNTLKCTLNINCPIDTHIISQPLETMVGIIDMFDNIFCKRHIRSNYYIGKYDIDDKLSINVFVNPTLKIS